MSSFTTSICVSRLGTYRPAILERRRSVEEKLNYS